MPTRETKAKISYAVDVAQLLATFLFMFAWVEAVHAIGTPKYFSSQFMATGFCNAPAWPTQWACVCFDAVGCLLFIAACAFLPSKACLPVAGYLAAHGYGHYEVATQKSMDHDVLDGKPADALLLMIILAIGPNEIFTTCRAAGVRLAPALAFGLLAEAAVCGVFLFVIKRSIFALLYINASIMCCICISRLGLLGVSAEAHVAARVDQPLFFAKLLSLSAVVAVMCAEPTLCERGFAAAGGHFWFDVALMADAIVGTYNVAGSFDDAKKGGAKKSELKAAKAA